MYSCFVVVVCLFVVVGFFCLFCFCLDFRLTACRVNNLYMALRLACDKCVFTMMKSNVCTYVSLSPQFSHNF